MSMIACNFRLFLTLAAFLFVSSANLSAASIVGTYYGIRPEAISTLTFLSDGRFMQIENNDPAINPLGQDGLEKGTYTWDSQTGALLYTTVINTNGEWGLCLAAVNALNCEIPPGITFAPTGIDGTITFPGEGIFTFPRLMDPASPIVGAWYISNGPNPEDLTVIAFLPDGRYLAGIDPPLIGYTEFGTYTFDPLTGAFTATKDQSDAPQGSSLNLQLYTSANIVNGRMSLLSDTAPSLVADNSEVPEPASFALLAVGLTTLFVRHRKVTAPRL